VCLERPKDGEDHFTTVDSLAWAYQDGEIETYLATMVKYLSNFGEGSELREKARDELAKGDDGFLKALLIVLCPRLKNVYFARGSGTSTDNRQSYKNTCLEWLCTVVLAHRDRPIETWPPGLQTLRHLGIGVETGTWLDEQYLTSPAALFQSICNLPYLESLYIWQLQ
jgi:hypothetical protein